MRRYLTFLAAGTLFSTVEEFLTVVILKRDVGSYVFTLVILFPVFLTIVFMLGRLFDRARINDLIRFFAFGTIGLMIEWFLIGLSPWSNPGANPILMALFQLGMFAFWATVACAPILFLREDSASVAARRSIIRLFLPYFALVYAVVLALPAGSKFGPTIGLIVLGYVVVAIKLVRYTFRPCSHHQRP